MHYSRRIFLAICAGLFCISTNFIPYAFADVPVINGADADNDPSYTNISSDPVSSTTGAEHSIENSNSMIETNNNLSSSSSIKLTPAERLSKLEHQVNNLNQADFQNQIQTLKQQVDELRGKLEEAEHTISQLKQQQLTGYQDLNNRISQLKTFSSSENSSDKTVSTKQASFSSTDPTNDKSEDEHPLKGTENKNKNSHGLKKNSVKTADSDTSTTSNARVDGNNTSEVNDKPSNQPASGASAKETKEYQASYGAIKSGNYAKAISTLKKYLQDYPKGQYAARAHYWLGEIYYIQNETQNAIGQFKTIIQTFPHDKKVADAKLKIGFIYFDNSEMSQAKTYLQDVVKNYPGTSTARLASARLKQMKNL